MNLREIIICIVIVFFTSCHNKKEVYFEYQNLQNNIWESNNILSFKIDSIPISENERYTVLLELNHTLDYPYTNLVLGYRFINGDSVMIINKKHIEITDRNGKRRGKGFFSNVQLTDTLKTNMQFNSVHNLSIEIIPLLNDEEIYGISRIGVRLIGE